jgi:hypothetical protein
MLPVKHLQSLKTVTGSENTISAPDQPGCHKLLNAFIIIHYQYVEHQETSFFQIKMDLSL